MDNVALFRVRAIGQLENAGVSHGAAFANALASVSGQGVTSRMLSTGDSAAQENSPTLNPLARHLDEVERHRAEANSLPGRIARSHDSGMHGGDVAVAMHRQARLMAAYNLDVMWSAKLLGVTAGAIKQLITAT